MSACRHRACGFTLLEMLVVMLIIGLTLALVQVNFAPGENSGLRDEMLRLETVLATAQDEVTAGGRPLVLELTDTGYRFLQRSGQEWQPISDGVLAPHTLPDTVRWGAVALDGTRPPLPVRVTWQVGAAPPALELELRTQNLSERLSIDPLGRINHAASDAT